MFELKNPKGTKDYLPQEQVVRRGIVRKLERIFEYYGYMPLETPTLCNFEVLSSKYAGGSEILKEVYKLKDQGERQLGLRYDLTVPFAKVIGMNPDTKMPFKRYEIGKVFRDGPVKTGRFREFTQCDVDMVGVKSMLGEAELMVMAVDAFNEMGLDVYISYNNRKLLSGFLQSLGVKDEMLNDVILTLDKVEKIPKEEIEKELLGKGLLKEQIKDIFDVINKNEDEFLVYVKENIDKSELLKEGYEEFSELRNYIEALDIKDKTKFNPVLARGLDIYTGTVFEFFLKDGCITSSLGAGGRYDKIIGAFLDSTNEYPAVGISFGLDVIFKAYEMKGLIDFSSPMDLYIISMGTVFESLKLSKNLREKGIKVGIEMTERKLKKSLDYANKSNIPYVVVIGENEVLKNQIKIKCMKSSEEKCISLGEIEEISQYINYRKGEIN